MKYILTKAQMVKSNSLVNNIGNFDDIVGHSKLLYKVSLYWIGYEADIQLSICLTVPMNYFIRFFFKTCIKHMNTAYSCSYISSFDCVVDGI